MSFHEKNGDFQGQHMLIYQWVYLVDVPAMFDYQKRTFKSQFDVLFDVDYVDLIANWNFYRVPSMMLKIKISSYSSWFYPSLHTLYTHYVSPVCWLMLLVTSSWSHVKTISVWNGYPIIALFHSVLSPDLAGRLFLSFVGIPIMMPVPQIVWFSSRV